MTIDMSTFCSAPFTSLYLSPDKMLAPCCINTGKFGLGIHPIQIEKNYNSTAMNDLRSDLLNGIKNESCKACWKSEQFSSDSMRTQRNNKFNDVDEILDNLNDDYSVKEIKFKFLDIRFSNECNLKCRTCYSGLSSMWHADEIKLGLKSKASIKIFDASGFGNIEYIFSHLPYVQEIYFAGGEPLININHYLILDELIRLNRQGEVKLSYNTNFSLLTYKNFDLIEIWKKFKNVRVGASLDTNYAKGEYLRKNLKWDDVIKNRLRMFEVPHIDFYIAATLSMMNAYSIVEFHKEWYESGYVDIDKMKVTLLIEPSRYCISNLPINHKVALIDLYNKHIDWIKSIAPEAKIISNFQGAINMLRSDSVDGWFGEWNDYTIKLDEIRNENFFEIFPEYTDLIGQ